MAALAINPLLNSQPFEETQDLDRKVSPQELQEFYREQESRDLQRRTSRRSRWSRRSTGKSITTLSSIRSSKSKERKADVESRKDDAISEKSLRATATPSPTPQVPSFTRKQGDWNSNAPSFYLTSYEMHDPVGPPVYRNYHLARKGPSVLPSKPPVAFHTHSTPNAAIPPLITPQSSPTTTPDSSQVNLPQRRRRISLNTPQDNVDMLDVTDPWGQTWHHDSRYDVGFDRNNDAGTQQPRPRTTSLKPAPAGAARPSPLSQSTSAIELPISVPKSTATRRLSKRRTSGLRGLFGGSTPAIHTQAKEFEAPAPKSGTGFEVMRRQSQSVPVTPTSSPQQVRMASEPAESPIKSPSTPVTNNLLSPTGFSPVKREKRNSMLGKLVKRFSVMKKPATSPADITPQAEVEKKAELSQQLEVSPPPIRPSSRSSMTRPEFGRAATSSPLLSTIIGSPNSSYNGKPDAPQVEPEPRRTPSPTKRVPPPRLEQDSTPVASTSTLHPAEVAEPQKAEAEDNATADDRSSLSLTYNPSSVGVLTIANPDPISTASTPVQRNNSLPSIASSRPPPLPSKDPEPTAERDIVVQVPTVNGLLIRSPPDGLGSLPPVERPFLPPLGVSSPFNMPSSMFGERTPRASMIPGAIAAEAATPLVRSNNPLPATPAPSSLSWPSVSDSQPSSVRLSAFDDSTDGERTPTRRRSPERPADQRLKVVRDVEPSPLPKRARTPTRRRSPERVADERRKPTREFESKQPTQRERARTPPRRRSPEKPADGPHRSVRDEAKLIPPREPPSERRSQVSPTNNRSSDDLTRPSPDKRPMLRDTAEDKRRKSSEKVPQKRESVRYSHQKDSPEKDPYPRRGERDSSGGRRASYNRETSDYRDSRTESGDRRRPSPEKAVDRRSSVVDKEKRGRSRVEETYRLVRSESKGEEISRGNMATVRDKGREWVVEEEDARRSWKRDSTSPVKESIRSRDAEREREGDRRSGNAAGSKMAVPAGPLNARASGHTDVANSVPWPSSSKSQDVPGHHISRASTATVPPSLPPKNSRPADPPPPAPFVPALAPAPPPSLPPRPMSKQPDSRKAQPISSSSTTATVAPPLPPRKEARRIEPVAPRLPPRPQERPVERTFGPVLPPRPTPIQKEKTSPRDVNVNKAQPPPPPPTPAPPPAPKLVPPPPPPPLPAASQPPPPPPPQSSSRLAAVPMARPASDMTPDSEHYFLKAREAWDADRLKRGKSSAFDAEADAYMWSQRETRPRPPPPPAIETWQQSWSQPVERRQSLHMSVSRPDRTSPTYHQAYPALNDGTYGSNHTSYSIQAPFLSNENSNQVYAPYRPARTPIPPFALDFDQSRSSNPLPTPPRQIAYDTPSPPRQGQPHSNQHISTEYWKNYSVTVPT